MIITKRYAQMLIRKGVARETGKVSESNKLYQCIDRLDLGRTDHFEINKDRTMKKYLAWLGDKNCTTGKPPKKTTA